jgi:hypothetical protein
MISNEDLAEFPNDHKQASIIFAQLAAHYAYSEFTQARISPICSYRLLSGAHATVPYWVALDYT